MILKRPCFIVLLISAGIATIGYAGTLLVTPLMRLFHVPEGNYNGIGPLIISAVVMLVGLFFTVLSLVWCLGSVIAAILSYLHRHQPEHPNWSDLRWK